MAQPKRRWSKARTHAKRSTWKKEQPTYTSCPHCHDFLEYFGENYPQVVQMAFASGNAPDIVEASAGITVNDLAKAGYVIPLTDILTPELMEDMHPDSVSALSLQYNGEPYAVPVRISGYRLFYNRDICIFEYCSYFCFKK